MNKIFSALSLGLMTSTGFAQQIVKPNIVFIYADDLGFGDLSCYGATRVQTPNVDGLARDGIRFVNAHSAEATSTPSRYGLLTGEYPWRRNGTGIAAGDAALIINPERCTVPKILKEAGYATGAVGNGIWDWAVKRENKTGTTR